MEWWIDGVCSIEKAPVREVVRSGFLVSKGSQREVNLRRSKLDSRTI